jgi:hypothetical protein
MSSYFKIINFCLCICMSVVTTYTLSAQIGNYIVNGSFEEIYDCDPPYNLNHCKSWANIGSDSLVMAGVLYSTDAGCIKGAPLTGVGYQWPRSGNAFGRLSFICINPCTYYYARSYPKNRLRSNLIANKTYCVKMYLCLEDVSPYAISNFGFYFGDSSTDTIKYANGPITYLNPQVSNPISAILTDTLNWVPITGTFVATGSEKYLVIGNFESNASTTMSLVLQDTTYKWSEYFVDDVSCIEVNLPAYAGPDKSIIPGDSVYIGRESDFAIDPGCMWYKLPNTTTAIDTSSGLWVKPTVTTTYVVKQTLDCSPEKWDTVVVFMNLVGIEKLRMLNEELKIYPIPAKDFIVLNISNQELVSEFKSASIYNSVGLLLKEEEIFFINSSLKIRIEDLPNGVYSLQLKSSTNETVSKRFVISR